MKGRSMKINKKITAASAAAVLLLAGCDAAAEDDEFDASGNVRITVAMGAGGGSDRGARVLAEALNEVGDGYNVVVENREGSGGAIGWSYVHDLQDDPQQFAKAEAAMNTLPLLDGVELPWTYADFTPIAMFAEDSRMLVAQADAEYDTCADLVGGGVVDAGMAGLGGPDGLTISLLEDAGVDVNVVPFSATGDAIAGLLGEQVDIVPVGPATAVQYIESGDLKGLCTFSEERYEGHEVLADLETAEEQGIDGIVSQWRGFLGPPEMPEAAQQFWIEEIQRAVETDTYQEYIEQDLMIETQLYGADFAEFLDEFDAQVQESSIGDE